MTLYEINQQYLTLLESYAAGEIPEEAINDTLEAIRGEFEEKADNIACYIKSLIAESKAIKDEMTALKERADAKERKALSLTNYLYNCLVASGRTKLETARSLLAIRKNPPSVTLENEEEFIRWARENANELLTFKPPVPDKAAIKVQIQSGANVPGAEVVQRERLVIK